MLDPKSMALLGEILDAIGNVLRAHIENKPAATVTMHYEAKGSAPATIEDTGKLPGAKKAVRTRRPKDEKKLKASDVMRPEVDDVDDDDSLDV